MQLLSERKNMKITKNYIKYLPKVRVRKYEIDKKTFQKMIKEHKIKSGLTNLQISKALNVPLTIVGHWFRTDTCFSYPSENIWWQFKTLLKLPSDFDEAITTFEEKDNVYDKSKRVYLSSKIAPTITTMCGNEKILVKKSGEKK